MQKVVLFLIFVLSVTVSYAFDQTYAEYGNVLKNYVKAGGVQYAALKKDRAGLDRYIEEVRATPKTDFSKWSRDQQLAFWLNTYNAWVLRIVIDHYPITRNRVMGLMYPDNSVQQIDGIWEKYALQTPAGKVSLNDIEHKILRGQFKEPRIHFCIVCASWGCPTIRNKPFVPENLSAQLEEAARNFVRSPNKVKLDRAAPKIELSSIFQWFSDDFRGYADDQWKHEYAIEKAGPIAFLSTYLSPDDALFLKMGGVDVSYIPYDWELNETK